MQMAIESASRRRFTVEEFLELDKLGMFERDDRLELIEGEILVMPAPGPEHNSRAMRFDYFTG
jgi:Uma2 family endonuclease